MRGGFTLGAGPGSLYLSSRVTGPCFHHDSVTLLERSSSSVVFWKPSLDNLGTIGFSCVVYYDPPEKPFFFLAA